MIKNKFLTNTSWMIGGKIFQMILSLLVSTIVVRYLGPSNYGLISYASSFIAFFSSICTLGLNGIIVRELVENQHKQGEILGTGIILRVVSSIISMIMILIMISIINSGDKILLIVTFLQSISLIFNSFDLINYWYQSKLQSKYPTIIQSIAYIIMCIYRVIILVMEKDVRWFAFATTLDIIIISSMLVIFYYKQGGLKLSFSIKTGKNLLKQSYHFIFAGIMVAIYAQIDKIMIGNMLDTKAVGLYSTAVSLCGIWSFIPGAFIDSARPLIMEQKNISEEIYIRRLKQLYSVIIWMSILYGIFITIFGKFIVVLLYGKEYIECVPALLIVVWYCSFSYLGSAKNIWLICEGKSKYEKWFTLLGAVTNIILNLIFIPILGIKGAALATLATQIMTNFIIPIIFKETRENSIYMLESLLLKDVISKSSRKNAIFKLRRKNIKSTS